MPKNVIHISEEEAASDFAALMARVRAGAEVIIESGKRPVAVLHATEPERRSVSECIALAKKHEEETGKAPVLDPDFAEDVKEILSHRGTHERGNSSRLKPHHSSRAQRSHRSGNPGK